MTQEILGMKSEQCINGSDRRAPLKSAGDLAESIVAAESALAHNRLMSSRRTVSAGLHRKILVQGGSSATSPSGSTHVRDERDSDQRGSVISTDGREVVSFYVIRFSRRGLCRTIRNPPYSLTAWQRISAVG